MENLPEYKELSEYLHYIDIFNLFLVQWGARPAFLHNKEFKEINKFNNDMFEKIAEIMKLKLLIYQNRLETYSVTFLFPGLDQETNELEFLKNKSKQSLGKLLGYVVPGSGGKPFLKCKYKKQTLWTESIFCDPDVQENVQERIKTRVEQFMSKVPPKFLEYFSFEVKSNVKSKVKPEMKSEVISKS